MLGPSAIGQAGPATISIGPGGIVEEHNPDPFDVGPFGQIDVTGGGILRTGGTLTPGGTTTIGTVTGVADGTTTIRALFQGFEATATVNIGSAAVPAISDWGLIIMAVLLLTAGRRVLVLRRA